MSKLPTDDDVPDLVKRVKNPYKFMTIPEVEEEKYPVLGAELIPEKYTSIIFTAPVGSGKTTAAFNIVNACAGRHNKDVTRRTHVFIFSASVNTDAGYLGMQKWMDKEGIPYTAETS